MDERETNPWVHTELAVPTMGEKIFDGAKIFLMGYGAYRLLGDIWGLFSRILPGRSEPSYPVHDESVREEVEE